MSATSNRTKNVLSFDVEHWYSATLLRDEVDDPEVLIEESIGIVLDLLTEYEATATFFIVGELARERPDLVRQIAAAGHEIGSHGHTHRTLFELSSEEFIEELSESSAAIHEAVGHRPAGFRAPNFSVTPRTEWAIEALESAGFQYDSSVFPVKTPMYGVNGAPLRPYFAHQDSPFVEQTAGGVDGLIELPLAVFHPRARLPVAGGFYARLLPTWFVQRGIRTLNARGIPATIYFHPWEFNPAVVTPSVPAHKRFVSFTGIDRLSAKLATLLETFEFTTAADIASEFEREHRGPDRHHREQPPIVPS